MPIRIAAAAAALLLLLIGVLSPAASAAAGASSVRPLAGPLWLVKSNDLALLRRQATADGLTLPVFATWVGCGGQTDPYRCRPGQQPIITSYWSLRRLAQSGWQGTAVFDIEPWAYTPARQRGNPRRFICLAARLQNIDPFLEVIITPYLKAKKMIRADVVAARCGAVAVDVQSQFANSSSVKFGRFIRKAVTAIRKVNRRTIILAGLATNSPHVQSAPNLVTDYHEALRAGVQGFWLNAKKWRKRSRCTAAQGGQGCPQVGINFLEGIGLIGGN